MIAVLAVFFSFFRKRTSSSSSSPFSAFFFVLGCLYYLVIIPQSSHALQEIFSTTLRSFDDTWTAIEITSEYLASELVFEISLTEQANPDRTMYNGNPVTTNSQNGNVVNILAVCEPHSAVLPNFTQMKSNLEDLAAFAVKLINLQSKMHVDYEAVETLRSQQFVRIPSLSTLQVGVWYVRLFSIDRTESSGRSSENMVGHMQIIALKSSQNRCDHLCSISDSSQCPQTAAALSSDTKCSCQEGFVGETCEIAFHDSIDIDKTFKVSVLPATWALFSFDVSSLSSTDMCVFHLPASHPNLLLSIRYSASDDRLIQLPSVFLETNEVKSSSNAVQTNSLAFHSLPMSNQKLQKLIASNAVYKLVFVGVYILNIETAIEEFPVRMKVIRTNEDANDSHSPLFKQSIMIVMIVFGALLVICLPLAVYFIKIKRKRGEMARRQQGNAEGSEIVDIRENVDDRSARDKANLLEMIEKYMVKMSYTELVMLYPSLENESKECAVCLEGFDSQTSKECRATPCFHVFHAACIESWLCKQMNCPSCRTACDSRSVLLRLIKGNSSSYEQRIAESSTKQNENNTLPQKLRKIVKDIIETRSSVGGGGDSCCINIEKKQREEEEAERQVVISPPFSFQLHNSRVFDKTDLSTISPATGIASPSSDAIMLIDTERPKKLHQPPSPQQQIKAIKIDVSPFLTILGQKFSQLGGEIIEVKDKLAIKGTQLGED